MYKYCFYLIACISIFSCSKDVKDEYKYDVIIIGGGASGVSAGLQASRQGASTLILEPTDWLGGMLTAAGVSAIDGNNNLPSGIWGEFRDSLVERYGSREALSTGWVSNTLFEPSVAQDIFTNMTSKEWNLEVKRNTEVVFVEYKGKHWHIKTKSSTYQCSVLIDATELGDIAAMLGLSYDTGMQDGDEEPLGPEQPNEIIQDLTWVATLQDFGIEADMTIPKPSGYDPSEFDCACNTGNPEIEAVDCDKMLDYGKLPGGKYMINWPNCGNDFYVNVIELSTEERAKAFERAKNMTLRFVYYIQNELGFRHLGLAEDTYPTKDQLAMIPYHRESRRVKGEIRLLSKHLAKPYQYHLYRTGIAVGDYPIDHHHKKNLEAPKIDFIGIQIPAYSIPLGSLIPKEIDHFIMAEKSISVSNIVNGTTRLQPVVLGIGQAAGSIAATAIGDKTSVKNVNIRHVQQHLLDFKAYLQPFMDVDRLDPDFEVLQKAAVSGLLKGRGVSYKWANQMWLDPDSLMLFKDLQLASFELGKSLADTENEFVSPLELMSFITAHRQGLDIEVEVMKEIEQMTNQDGFLTRRSVAVLTMNSIDLFERPVNYQGEFMD